MIKKILLSSFAFLMAINAKSQNTNGKDIANKLCGCFEVSFKYAETFSPDTAYKFH